MLGPSSIVQPNTMHRESIRWKREGSSALGKDPAQLTFLHPGRRAVMTVVHHRRSKARGVNKKKSNFGR